MSELLQQLKPSARALRSLTRTVPRVCQAKQGNLTKLTDRCLRQAGDHDQLAVYAAQVRSESCAFIVSSL
jgi:hypothetical protein